MIDTNPHNDVVRACFENPDHAGDLQGDYPVALRAEVSESEQGARLILSAGIAEGAVAEMRFRAWGCPHFIAAAETLCKEREKGPVAGLQLRPDLNALMQQLSVPVEKTGKMLLLEDALRLLWAQHSRPD